MKILILFILISLAVVCVAAQTPPPSTALQEAEKISAEAVKLFQQKKYDEAAPLAQKAITIREIELGKNHISVAQAWRNLAYIQLQREKQKEAAQAFKDAFEIYEQNHPLSATDEKMFAEMLEAVAVYEAANGDLLGAEKKLSRAVALREKVNGKDSEETAGSLFKLAQLFQLRGDQEQAAPLLLRAFDIKLKTRNSEKLDEETYEIYTNANCALQKLRREDEQDRLHKKLYPSNSNAAGRNKPVSGGALNGKALSLPKPAYPAEAREKRASGAVTVMVTVDESGKVKSACAVSGAKELQRATEIAAYQAKFPPMVLNGQPIKVVGVITYNFVP
jgi:TonB family protein